MTTLLSEKEVSKLWSDAHNDTSDRMAHQVFATLVEQRLIAKLLEGVGEPAFDYCLYSKKSKFEGSESVGYTAEQVAAAVLAERERCAKVCESAINSIWDFHDDNRKQIGRTVCTNLAAAIRGATT